MATIAQNIGAIRRRLGNPLDNSPSDALILQALTDHLHNHQASLVNTRNHWSVDKFRLAVSDGVEDYVVAAANFGRPFLVYTVDDTDAYHWRREVPFTLLQDADQRYQGPVKSGSADEHSAVEIAFYRREGLGWYCRLIPMPAATGEYEIWYETNYQYSGLSDAPGLEAFHHLVRIQAALSVLPDCEWDGIRKREQPQLWQTEAQARAAALMRDEQIFKTQFDNYRAQSSRESVNSKLGYAFDYEEDSADIGIGRMISGYGY